MCFPGRFRGDYPSRVISIGSHGSSTTGAYFEMVRFIPGSKLVVDDLERSYLYHLLNGSMRYFSPYNVAVGLPAQSCPERTDFDILIPI
jgi:hypothetical protein